MCYATRSDRCRATRVIADLFITRCLEHGLSWLGGVEFEIKSVGESQ